jgi:N-methylhydantoinase B
MPAGAFRAEDWLDDDGVTTTPCRIAVQLQLDPQAGAVSIDFTGSSAQVAGSINAARAITTSACFYMLRCLLAEDAPATAGILRALTLKTPPGSIVDARPPAPVAGGNVETSQRIVDVLLRALAQAVPSRVPAASAGTMSNLTIGGIDPHTGEPFTYYETAAGGMGARPTMDGISGVQTHMTNSLNTPIEALEYAYPFRVRRYAYRYGSGGAGRFRGGDGLIRELELLSDAQVTLPRRPPQHASLWTPARRRRRTRPRIHHGSRRETRNRTPRKMHATRLRRHHPAHRDTRRRRMGCGLNGPALKQPSSVGGKPLTCHQE